MGAFQATSAGHNPVDVSTRTTIRVRKRHTTRALEDLCFLVALTGDVACEIAEQNDHFAAEDEDFLDAVAAALEQLTADCKSALRWSHDDDDASAAIQAAEQSFCTIRNICREAGLIITTELSHGVLDLDAWGSLERTADSFTLVDSARDPTAPWIDEPFEHDQDCCFGGAVHPPPAPIQWNPPPVARNPASPLSPTEEIVEVELTDLLTQSRGEMLDLQRIFEARMAEAERTRDQYEHRHTEEMHSLQEELTSSRLAMGRIKQELLDSTTRKLEDMHSAITTSQKAIEAGMHDQARYWKSICQELVEEKRDMAQKVAEERGKYTALKAHLASHDDASTKLSHPSRVPTRRARDGDSVDNLRLCTLSSPGAPSSTLRQEHVAGNQVSNEESTACSTPSGCSSAGLVVVPSADSASDPSSAEVSPTHSSTSSSKAGKPTFRRYYLAQKRANRVVLH
jgi:hypothetical protein